MKVLKYLRLPFFFDKDLMKKEVELLTTSLWLPHYQVKHYEGNWSAIPLRNIDGNNENIFVSEDIERVYKNTELLNKTPYLEEILNTFKCPLLSVRLLKLNAGSKIKEHKDRDLNYEKGEIRIHIPVTTHQDVQFILDNELVFLNEGECWYMNFNLPHSISNNSNIDRIHLVIDAEVNDWIRDLFSSSDCIKKEIEDVTGIYDDETKLLIIRQLREMNTSVSNKMAEDLEMELRH